VSLRLTAAKSRMGHAEPAAGTVGIAQAIAMLTQQRVTPLTHLRRVNPLIVGASKAAGGRAPALPRQRGPAAIAAPDQDAWQAVQGVSSFAFQGTNAHAVLCLQAGSQQGIGSGGARPVCWNRQRFWYTVPAHQLLQMAGFSVAKREATFQMSLARACLGKQSPVPSCDCFPAVMFDMLALFTDTAHRGWVIALQCSALYLVALTLDT
jgi:acyl transferase domain-containing protein